jgi:hypothetical protein
VKVAKRLALLLATGAEKWKRKSGKEAEEEAEKHLASTWHGH